jgi:hypothetical protein
MIPSLSLGPPWDAPQVEITRPDLYPILAALVGGSAETDKDLHDCVFILLSMDGIFLDPDVEPFFAAFEATCRQIVGGHVTAYDPRWIEIDDFQSCVAQSFINNGTITPGAKVAAKRFLDFLAAHPDLWPPSTARQRGEA